MSSFYIQLRKKRYGPLTLRELSMLKEQGAFSEQDLVWDLDEARWMHAGESQDLTHVFADDGPPDRALLAVGGGKGGVGKTVIAASLGVALASMGNKVVIVDMDLGGANLHNCFGMLEPRHTFFDFYTCQKSSLEEIMLDTPIEGLKIISGACGTLGLANPNYYQKIRFIRELKQIEADYVILDLGAGTGFDVLDFFLAAEEGIVVTTPDLSATEECFSFLKVVLLRKLKRSLKDNRKILSLLVREDPGNLSNFHGPISDMAGRVVRLDPQAGLIFETILAAFRPKLILNTVVESEEVEAAYNLIESCRNFLGINVEFLGYLEQDRGVREAVKKLRPFLLEAPESKASRSLLKIVTLKLLEQHRFERIFKKRRAKKHLVSSADSMKEQEIELDPPICSVKCFYWGECEFQNGGYPCGVQPFGILYPKPA